jgi:hypothetical protein
MYTSVNGTGYPRCRLFCRGVYNYTFLYTQQLRRIQNNYDVYIKQQMYTYIRSIVYKPINRVYINKKMYTSVYNHTFYVYKTFVMYT